MNGGKSAVSNYESLIMSISTDEALKQYLKERDRQWEEDQKNYKGPHYMV